MYCKNCGNEINNDTRYCPNCGCKNSEETIKFDMKSDQNSVIASKGFCCPECGNENLQISTETNVQTYGKSFSAGQGCLGYLIFGPLGILCGSCGQGQKTSTTNTTYWACAKCGKKFRNPEELIKEADKGNKIFIISMILGIIFSIIVCACMVSYVGSFHPVLLIPILAVLLGFCIPAFIFKFAAKKWITEANEIKNGMCKFKK